MKVLSALVLCMLSINCIDGHSAKRSLVFKTARKCAKENGIDFKVVTKFLKGNFSQETRDAKCFLKCVADDLEFWIGEEPQTQTMLKYVDLLTKSTDGTGDVINQCIANDVSDDFCEHLYNVYQCFWTRVVIKPNPGIEKDFLSEKST